MISFVGLIEAFLATGLCFCIVRGISLFGKAKKQNVVAEECVHE